MPAIIGRRPDISVFSWKYFVQTNIKTDVDSVLNTLVLSKLKVSVSISIVNISFSNMLFNISEDVII